LEIEQKAKSIDRETYFQILGVSAESSIDDAKTAYFALAKTWHPDRLAADLVDLKSEVARIFTLMAEAYQTLTDPDRRAKYLQLTKQGGGTPEDQAEVARVMEATTAFQKAEFFVGKGHLAEAEPHAKRALELDPQAPDHVAVWIWIQASKPERRESAKYDDLLPRLDALLLDNPRHERARYYRAMILKAANRMNEAIRDFKEIVEQNPKNVDAVREVRLYTMRQDRDRKPKDEGAGSLFGRFMKKK
jgi:curved DNA-binding protein CbpA